jgi:hypothetical protein
MNNDLNQAQPPPQGGADVDCWHSLIAAMTERRRLGIEHYGTPLHPFNGRRALIDLSQELLDALVYLQQELEERRSLEGQLQAALTEVARLRLLHARACDRIVAQSELLTRLAEKQAVAPAG